MIYIKMVENTNTSVMKCPFYARGVKEDTVEDCSWCQIEKLVFEPDEEVVDARTADSHFKRRFRVGDNSKSSAHLFYYAADSFH